MKKRIYIIDVYNLLYRLFYAVPSFTTKSGEVVNAVFWMAKTFLSLADQENIDYLFVVSDSRGPNFRSKIYPEYKATRDRMPDDLRSQEKRIEELFSILKIPVLALMGYEADDIIGTLVTKLKEDVNNDIYILSGDKDLYQFIAPNVAVYDTMKRITARREEAFAKFGVYPEHVVDYLSIVGDSSDNIPGIPGFGPKKAESLIGQFWTLENIYEHLNDVSEKLRVSLEEHKETAFLSKRLASIDTAVPIDFSLEEHVFSGRNLYTEELYEFFKTLEFKSLLPKDSVKLLDFSSLGISYTPIRDISWLDLLIGKIVTAPRIGLKTVWKNGNLTSIALGFPNGPYFLVESAYINISPLIEALLEFSGEIVGYDLKTDLKALYNYQDQSNESLTEWNNLSLF